jgi:small multidrug resistance pump
MTAWAVLGFAILVEVSGTLALRAASTSHWAWYLVTVAAYSAAFWALSIALSEGLSLSVAYGVWAACGVALTAVASHLIFGEAFTVQMGIGIALVAAGVLLVEAGSDHASPSVHRTTSTLVLERGPSWM